MCKFKLLITASLLLMGSVSYANTGEALYNQASQLEDKIQRIQHSICLKIYQQKRKAGQSVFYYYDDHHGKDEHCFFVDPSTQEKARSTDEYKKTDLLQQQANDLYRQASDKGHLKARFRLYENYKFRDYNKCLEAKALADELLNQAEDVAIRLKTLVELGIQYELGICVRKDIGKAKEYYGQACDEGSQKGCEMFNRLQQEKTK